MLGVLITSLALGGLSTPVDTVLDIREGDRLFLQDFAGSVHVETWNRPGVLLEAESDDAVVYRVERTGDRIEIRVEDRKRRNRAEELRIVVPPWANLDFSGRDLEVWVLDVRGTVKIRNLRGDVTLRNLHGTVDVHSLEGSVEAFALTGSARLRTGEDEITVAGSSADLSLETVEGEITLDGVDSRRISAETTDGDVEFTGRFLPGGEYSFVSHAGDLEFNLDAPVSLAATVLVYGGDFESEFPVLARGYRTGNKLEFTVGEGEARLTVEAFDGSVELLRGRNRGQR